VRQSIKKPRPVKKPGNTVRSRPKAGTVRKKNRRKLSTRDKIHAVLAAAILILAAAVSSLTVMYFNSVKQQKEVAESVQPSTPLPAAEAPLPVVQAPPPVAQATLPAVQAPPAPEIAAPATEAPPPVRPAPLPAAKPAVPVPANPAPAAENRPAETRPVETAPTPAAALPAGGIKERPAPSRGSLVFVIDDVGYNLRELEPFLKFPGPLTLAVLPGLAYSAEAARRIRAAGKEVFLHQPMEATGGQNPGPGAIRSGMSRDEIRAVVNRNLDEIWPVAGINNHEGSRITGDEDAMETVLALCRERGILFLDSRTTAETAAPKAARQLGMSIGERDVFVDNVQKKESMIAYINTGLAKAEKNGSAIMIGHVWSPALAPLLSELYPKLEEEGYSLSPASKVIGGTGE